MNMAEAAAPGMDSQAYFSVIMNLQGYLEGFLEQT